MTKVNVISLRELSTKDMTADSQVLVKKGNDYFVISSVDAVFAGPETLVFPANKDGKITDWSEVVGGHGMSREEAIQALEELDA